MVSLSESGSIGILNDAWIYNGRAKHMLVKSFSAFYALIIILFALVLELAQVYDTDTYEKTNSNVSKEHVLAQNKAKAIEESGNSLKNHIFGIYMYGGSLAIFFFFYIYLLFGKKANESAGLSSVSSETTLNIDQKSLESTSTSLHSRHVSHNRPSAGSMFERLGMVIFGIIGVVYYAFPLFIYAGKQNFLALKIVQDILSIIFFFIQMHFLFCNSNLNIKSHYYLARFGFMHLVATNIWTWIRYIMIEEAHMKHEIREMIQADNIYEHKLNSTFNKLLSSPTQLTEECDGAACLMETFGDIMYTCIVEYSLICAGITFSLWRNISYTHLNEDLAYVSRKQHIRIDCTNTTTGLFSGLAFFTATLTSTAAFYTFRLVHEGQKAVVLFNLTDLLQYSITIFVCCYAVWKMRFFQYSDLKSVSQTNQQFLDNLLLLLGVMGELLYSITGVVGLMGAKEFKALNILLIITHIVRLCQVGVQSCLLYIAMQLKAPSDKGLGKRNQPGKQLITFLIICNISMFLMNMLETGQVGASESIVNFYGKYSWVVLVRSFSPLTIFFRFHSAVCFVEVWKNVYSNK
uniref:Otopetrin-2 n=1 Tax=Rhabditophanes sp. KR3021 TaxID=114890 RepID=A0AC35TZD7_9BILA